MVKIELDVYLFYIIYILSRIYITNYNVKLLAYGL